MLRLLVARGKISQEVVENRLTWRHPQYDWRNNSGFSVHAGVRVEERAEAVRLGRYGIHCPLVLERRNDSSIDPSKERGSAIREGQGSANNSARFP